MLDECKAVSLKYIIPYDVSNLSFIFFLMSLIYSSLILHQHSLKTLIVLLLCIGTLRVIKNVAINKTVIVLASIELII